MHDTFKTSKKELNSLKNSLDFFHRNLSKGANNSHKNMIELKFNIIQQYNDFIYPYFMPIATINSALQMEIHKCQIDSELWEGLESH